MKVTPKTSPKPKRLSDKNMRELLLSLKKEAEKSKSSRETGKSYHLAIGCLATFSRF